MSYPQDERATFKAVPLDEDSSEEEGDSSGARPRTVPLEQMSMPPQLASTLQHIVGQLDVLTQVGGEHSGWVGGCARLSVVYCASC